MQTRYRRDTEKVKVSMTLQRPQTAIDGLTKQNSLSWCVMFFFCFFFMCVCTVQQYVFMASNLYIICADVSLLHRQLHHESRHQQYRKPQQSVV